LVLVQELYLLDLYLFNFTNQKQYEFLF